MWILRTLFVFWKARVGGIEAKVELEERGMSEWRIYVDNSFEWIQLQFRVEICEGKSCKGGDVHALNDVSSVGGILGKRRIEYGHAVIPELWVYTGNSVHSIQLQFRVKMRKGNCARGRIYVDCAHIVCLWKARVGGIEAKVELEECGMSEWRIYVDSSFEWIKLQFRVEICRGKPCKGVGVHALNDVSSVGGILGKRRIEYRHAVIPELWVYTGNSVHSIQLQFRM